MGTIPYRKLKVAAVGGSIGGSCLAVGLLRHPRLDVQVYEAAHKFSEIGAGVAFGPNVQRALILIGPEAEQAFLNQATRHVGKAHRHTWFQSRYRIGPHDGEVICTPKNETVQQTVHRAKSLEELVKLVQPSISCFGKRSIKIDDQGDDPVLNFKDETSVTTDCVIGMDRIHGAVREYLLGVKRPALSALFSRSVAYHGLIPTEEAKAKLGSGLAEVSNKHCGDGGVIMPYPIGFNRTLNIVAIDSNVES